MVSIFEPDVADMIKRAFFVRPQPLFNRENIVGLNVHRLAYKQFKIMSTFSCGLQRPRKSTIRLDEALDVAVFSRHTTTEDFRRCPLHELHYVVVQPPSRQSRVTIDHLSEPQLN